LRLPDFGEEQHSCFASSADKGSGLPGDKEMSDGRLKKIYYSRRRVLLAPPGIIPFD
jgi:hypothetical protein